MRLLRSLPRPSTSGRPVTFTSPPPSADEGLIVLSHEHGVVFVHVRKAAGTSIKRALSVPAPWDSYLQDGTADSNWPAFAERDRYVVFAVVRNPWDRFVSAWHYLYAYRYRSIDDVLNDLPQPDGDRQERHDYRHLTRQQTDLLIDGDGRWAIDRVLRFERLQEDFDSLCRDLGIHPIQLGHVQRTAGRSPGYRDLFSPEALETFAKHYERDVHLLGYDF